jgi:hypothetical protein
MKEQKLQVVLVSRPQGAVAEANFSPVEALTCLLSLDHSNLANGLR